jgi:CP family cyanate transporter-like MFS transporter
LDQKSSTKLLGQPRESPRVPFAILISAMLLAIAMWAPLLCIPPMEYILKEELQITHAQTSLLYNIPLWMTGVVALPAGLIADRIGFRKAAAIGATLIAVGSTLRGTATDMFSLLTFTFIYGVGFGWAFSSLPKMISASIPREKTGIATGVYSAGIFIGQALAISLTIPFVFPLTNSFQGVFFIWSIPAIVVAVIFWISLKEPSSKSLNIESSPTSNVFFQQLLSKTLKNKDLLLLASVHALHLFFYYTWIGWAPTLFMSKGGTPGLAGFISSLTFWVAIPAAFMIPRLAHRVGLWRPFLLAAAIMMVIAALAWAHISLDTSWLPMVLVGLADCAILVTVLALPLEMVPKEEVGAACGLVITAGHIGGPIGPLVGGHILDITGSLNRALIVLAGVATAMVGIWFKLPKSAPKRGAISDAYL